MNGKVDRGAVRGEPKAACLALAAALGACGGGGGAEPSGTPSDDGAALAPCGAVTVASMSWASAALAAEVDRLILDAGYGCDVTLVDGDTVPTFRSMAERGEPDLAPELWVAGVREPFDEAVAAGRLVLGAETLSDGGLEGWWIPGAFADAHPEIRSVQDALARPELFPSTAGGGPGAVHNCPVGWNCEITTANLFRAHGADAMGFTLVDTGSAQGLDDSVARAVEAGEGWLGYYWAPTSLAARHRMVRLDAPPHDVDEWARCTTVRDCPDPAPVDYPRSEVRAVAAPGFAERAAVAMDYVERRGWDNATVGAVLAWMEDEGASPERGARRFLTEYEPVWTAWVDAAVAARVKAAL